MWDDRILEWIEENEDGATPKKLEQSDLIRISRSQISRRCRKLAEHGLLLHIGNGAYIITEEGRAYLQGEYDAAEDAQPDSPKIDNDKETKEEGDTRGG